MNAAMRNSREAVEERRRRWGAALESEVQRMVRILSRRPEVREVILFGSLGRGTARFHSDIDLLIVADTDLRLADRIEQMLRLLRPRISADVIVYTPREWASDPGTELFRRRVRAEGRVLYAA